MNEPKLKPCPCCGREAEMKWIPITERLPIDGEVVLAWDVPKMKWLSATCSIKSFAKKGNRLNPYDSATRGKKNIFYDYDSECGYLVYDNVTHWMPLPKPPEVNINE